MERQHAERSHRGRIGVLPMTAPIHLYSPADVKKVRLLLYDEQDGKDALTGLDLPKDKQCLDHNHKTQFVRGVLHRQINCALGKLEGVYARYLSTWYPGSLSDFLRLSADFLEKGDDNRYVHPGFIKRLCTDFASLNEKGKKEVLHLLGQPQGNNATERKKLFRSALMTRKFTYDQVKAMIEERKKI